jgi:hypothetical protein
MLIGLMVWKRPADADDFVPFYRAAAHAKAHADVYSQPTSSPAVQTEGKFLPYIRIPSYAAALIPLTALPYPVSRAIWIASLIAALVACIVLDPGGHRSGMALALAFSFPVADALMIGQDIPFVLLIVLAATRIFSMGREFLAGLMASLLGIKVTYLPAVGMVFLANSRRATAGLIAGFAAQLAISFLIGGTNWPAEYLSLLRSPLMDPDPRRMLNVRAVAESLSLPGWLYILAGVALYAAFWFVCRKLTVPDGLTLALALSVIAAPHCKIYDGVALIPLLLRTATLKSWTGRLALVGLMPVLYILVLAGTGWFELAGSSLTVLITLVCATQLVSQALPPALTRFPPRLLTLR